MSKSKTEMRSFNIQLVGDVARTNLQIFSSLKKASLSIANLTKETNLSSDLVAECVNSCIRKDLLTISGSGEGEVVTFKENQKNVLGVGFSGNKCILVAMNLAGEIVAKEIIEIKQISTLKGRIKEMKEILSAISKGTKLRGTGFFSVGIALPEEIKKNPKCPGVIVKGINKLFGCTVLFTDAITAAGYAEKGYEAEASSDDVLYLHSDVGSGVAIRGEEIVDPEGSSPGDDKSYLRPWEQFDMVMTAKSLVKKGVGTDIVNMVGGKTDEITSDVVLTAAENKDELAEDLVKRSALALGVRAAYLVNIFGTDKVILGGGTEKKEGNFIQYVGESSQRFLLNKVVNMVKIVPGTLGAEAFSIGAASLCRRELFMEV